MRDLARRELNALRAMLMSDAYFQQNGFVSVGLFNTLTTLQREVDEAERAEQSLKSRTSTVNSTVCTNLSSSSASSTASSTTSPPPLFGSNRVLTSVTQISNATEALPLLLHAIMLDAGFVCVTEVPNSVPGFAPALRELPKSKFLPEGWNMNENATSIKYKHKAKSGKIFTLTCVVMHPETIVCTLSERGGGSFTAEFVVSRYVNVNAGYPLSVTLESNPTDIYINENECMDRFMSIVGQACPGLVTPPQATVSGPGAGSATTFIPPPVSSPTSPFMPPTEPRQPQGDGWIPPRIGGGDLNPIPGLEPYPMPGRPGVGNFGGDTGSEIGPNHPFFFPEGGGLGGILPSGGGAGGLLPQPRFDPFGPVVGPHGPNFGDPGFPGRGGRGGPARGGRGGRPRVPGEPDPDHLRPPNADWNDYI